MVDLPQYDSSVGMMTFPIYGKIKKCSKAPTSYALSLSLHRPLAVMLDPVNSGILVYVSCVKHKHVHDYITGSNVKKPGYLIRNI